MEMLAGGRPTNLTELWWSEEKQALLELNGFSGGSDYELLRDFCQCLSRAEGSHWEWQCRQELVRLGLADADLRNPRELWNRSVDRLEAHPLTAEEGAALLRLEHSYGSGTSVSQAASVPLICAIPFSEGQTDASCWEEWRERAETFLEKREERVPLLLLPTDHQTRKPDLYHVNRHLLGEERSNDLWRCQMAVFLLRYCRRQGIRAALDVHCSASRLFELLDMAERFTPLPDLILSADVPTDRAEILSLCRRILAGRERNSRGTPPVLFAKPHPFLPSNLMVRLSRV